jgi:uncharacterized protein (DUF2147 family)
MRIILASFVAGVLLSGQAFAAGEMPNGTWLTQDGSSKVRIAPCGQTYCATIVWVKPLAPGETDPHPALAGKSLIGTHLSRDLQRTSDGLAGRLLNPENGKSYDVTVKLSGQNALEMGGCVLGGLLCGSETWTRASEEVAAVTPKPAGTPTRAAAKPAKPAAAPAAVAEADED